MDFTKQISEAVESGRKDLTEELLMRYADRQKQEEKQDEFYLNASPSELRKLSLSGDDVASAHYVRRRIDDDELCEEDLKLLDTAIYNLCMEAALMGEIVYGTKGSPYKDDEKEYFCHAVLEQYGEKENHKKLDKAAKKLSIVSEIDSAVFQTCVAQWAGGVVMRDKYFGCTAEVVPAQKENGMPDYKSAYEIHLRLIDQNGREGRDDYVYTFYVRGKKADCLRQLCTDLSQSLTSVAEKCGLKSVDIYLEGSRQYHYGGAIDPTLRKDAKLHILSDAELDINISDDGALSRNVCPYCGGDLGDDGACVSCGKKVETNNDGIHIKRAKESEAMICSQCGFPVALDGNGKTAYCPACGTTFAVNGNALSGGVRGLNYDTLKADMPIGAELPNVKFMRARIGNMVTAVMPSNFIVMPEDMRRLKYPTNPPDFIYTTPDSTVNLCLKSSGNLSDENVFAFGQQMLGMLKKIQPTAKFGEVKQITTSKNIFFFEFITAAVDQDIYNGMSFFSLHGKQCICSWNCLGKDRWFWAPIFEHAVRTMEFG